MKQLSIIFLLLCPIIGLSVGCKDDTSKNGGVGIIDIEKVATAMGWSAEMRKNLVDSDKKCRAEVEAYLKPFSDAYENKLAEIKKANNMSDDDAKAMKTARQMTELEKLKLSKTQIEELTRVAVTYAQEANAAGSRMNQVIQAHQQALVTACSQAADPAIRRVAAANHRSVILTPAGSVLYVDSSADLTDKVVDDLQHSTQTKVTLPDPPRLDLRPPALPATQPR